MNIDTSPIGLAEAVNEGFLVYANPVLILEHRLPEAIKRGLIPYFKAARFYVSTTILEDVEAVLETQRGEDEAAPERYLVLAKVADWVNSMLVSLAESVKRDGPNSVPVVEPIDGGVRISVVLALRTHTAPPEDSESLERYVKSSVRGGVPLTVTYKRPTKPGAKSSVIITSAA